MKGHGTDVPCKSVSRVVIVEDGSDKDEPASVEWFEFLNGEAYGLPAGVPFDNLQTI